MKKICGVCLLVVLVGTAACRERSMIVGEGTMVQGVGPECPGTWGIATAEGGTYWPVEDSRYQRAGIRVKFVARSRPDRVSVCMAGTIVDIVSLQAR